MFVDYPSWLSPYVIEGLPVRWYAVMYIFAFATAYFFYSATSGNDVELKCTKEEKDDFFLTVVISLLLGARIGSCIFYDDALYYLTHPWMILWPFRGGKFTGLPGMSYHGGVIGAVTGGLIYSRRKKMPFFRMADHIALSVPFAYTWGRLGNFFNGELYGRVTTSSIGMVFPDAERFSTAYRWVRDFCDEIGLAYVPGESVNLPRWPSQLFEAFFEGIVLGLFLWLVVKRLKQSRSLPDGTVLSFYLMGYGAVRFIIEYFRQPDSDIGYVIMLGKRSSNIHVFESLLNFSKGQVFCFIMIASGALLLISVSLIRKKQNDKRKS